MPTSGPVHDELVATGRALLIAPLPNRGLQPEHLDTIEAFVSDTTVPDTGRTGTDALDLGLETARRLLGHTA